MLKTIKIIINYKDLKEKCLMQNWGYSEQSAAETIKDIRKMSQDVFKAFWKWYSKGQSPEGYFCGVNFQELVCENDMTPVAAFLYIDWYQKDPQKAYEALSHGIKDDDMLIDKDELCDIISRLPEETRRRITRSEDTQDITRDVQDDNR